MRPVSEEERRRDDEKLRAQLTDTVVVRKATLGPGSYVYVGLVPVWHGADEGAREVAECIRNQFFEAVQRAKEEHKQWT